MCLIGTICDMMPIGSCTGLIGIRKRLMQLIYYDPYLVQTYFINERGIVISNRLFPFQVRNCFIYMTK